IDRRNDATAGSRPGPYGVAGAVANTPGQPPAGNSATKYDTNRKNEVTNYEIPQTIRKTSKASGQVKKLSVAVVVDGKRTKTVGKDGKTIEKVEAWSDEKRKEFEDVVATAVGLDRKRGDTLEIKSMEFQTEDFDEASKVMAEKDRKVYVQNMVMYGVIGLTIALFFFFVVRPFIKWVTENTIDSVDSFLPQTIEELERLQKNASLPGMEDAVPVLPEQMDPEKVEGEMIKEKIITLVDANPHKAALILRDWLHNDGKKKAAEAAAAAAASGGKDKTA
ncbi:flagellar M-ring protein FliF C-terminal domain-containing protein, partial [Bdellovibrionota bacterium FG-2]